MAIQTNIEMQERFGNDVANGGHIDVLDELLAEGFVDHDPAPDQAPGPAGFKAFWTSFRDAFPDLAVDVDQMVADDDTVAIAYRASGTHDGDFQGYSATGKRFEIRGVQITAFADGRMTERWGASDEAGLRRQLGLE